jgi:hypothetical protein
MHSIPVVIVPISTGTGKYVPIENIGTETMQCCGSGRFEK